MRNSKWRHFSLDIFKEVVIFIMYFKMDGDDKLLRNADNYPQDTIIENFEIQTAGT
jgi:hypothetical protein